jgi:hypothetical protein
MRRPQAGRSFERNTVKRKRDLIVTNVLALVVILSALVAGWGEAALFGLVVLLVMDLIALLRERAASADLHIEKEEELEMNIDPHRENE